MPRIVEHYGATTGCHVSVQIDADTGLRTYQSDFSRVHAAKARNVQGERRPSSFGLCRVTNFERCCVDVVQAGDHVQSLRVDGGIDLHSTSKQSGALKVPAIQAVPGDVQKTAGDAKGLKRPTAAEYRQSGCQDATRYVDEAAAVAGQAIGVANDDFRSLACDLQIAGNVRWQRARDLVDDNSRRIAREIGVARNEPSDLRLHDGARVVENDALRGDVELVVLILRDAGCGGRCDIHQRQAVRRRADARCMRARGRDDLSECRHRKRHG